MGYPPKIESFKGTKRQKLTADKFLRMETDQVWLFRCDCGGTKERKKQAFLRSTTNNCGCWHGLAKHNMAWRDKTGKRSRAYLSWVNMRQRCTNPNNPDYALYGGRGIKICKRWDDFKNFFEDMGERPEGMTLDRIDVNDSYSPSNCRWANRFDQSNNRNYNKLITYNGQSKTLGQWRKELPFKIGYSYLRDRLTRGWSIEKAFTTPVAPKFRAKK